MKSGELTKTEAELIVKYIFGEICDGALPSRPTTLESAAEELKDFMKTRAHPEVPFHLHKEGIREMYCGLVCSRERPPTPMPSAKIGIFAQHPGLLELAGDQLCRECVRGFMKGEIRR